jgi:hemerythrin-like domain-containing protein
VATVCELVRAEHRAFHALMSRSCRARRPEDVRVAAARLAVVIESHAEREEKLLFPLARGELTAHLEVEHASLRRDLRLAGQSGLRADLVRACQNLYHHFEEEETEFLPLVEATVEVVAQARAGARWAEARALAEARR